MAQPYENVNGKKVTICKFGCGSRITWDTKGSYYVEIDHENIQHTRERCKAFKEINQDPNKKQAVDTLKEIENNNHNNKHTNVITLEQVLSKLRAIGIDIDINKLLKESDYIK